MPPPLFVELATPLGRVRPAMAAVPLAADLDPENAVGMVAINCQVIRTGAVDAEHRSTSSSPVVRANGTSDSEVDRVAVMGVRDRLTQRARAAVVRVADGDVAA